LGRISHIERSFATPGTSAYLAHFWRESATLVDAIKRWAAENPSIPGGKASNVLLEFASDMTKAALEEKKAAESSQKTAGEALEKNIPLRDMFPGVQDALTRTKDPIEALIGSSAPGSPARKWAEAFKRQVEAASICARFTNLADRVAIKNTRKARAKIESRLIASLGERGTNYRCALRWIKLFEEETLKLKNSRPLTLAEMLLFHEAMQTLLPLVCLFANPDYFFNQLLPQADPPELRRPVRELLERWGVGVLLNTGVREAFLKEAAKPGFSKALSKLEKRAPFRGAGGAPRGTPPGVRDYRSLATTYYSLPKPERSAWLEKEANQMPFITVASLRRLLSKNRVK
jgi:hypothetical protein